MRILVTGGAGYIGSHFVTQALKNGFSELIVVDDLSTGFKTRLPEKVEFHQLDLASETTQSRLTYILEQNIDAVVHFAANKAVAESVVNPEKYFHTNIGATVNLLSAM